jgi:hypothetical protein
MDQPRNKNETEVTTTKEKAACKSTAGSSKVLNELEM